MKSSAMRSLIEDVLDEAHLEHFDPSIVEQLLLVGKAHENDILNRARDLSAHRAGEGEGVTATSKDVILATRLIDDQMFRKRSHTNKFREQQSAYINSQPMPVIQSVFGLQLLPLNRAAARQAQG